VIVPMKKATIITQAKDAEAALFDLRRLGVVHVEQSQVPAGKDINLVKDDLALVNQALEIIFKAEFASECAAGGLLHDVSDWRATCRHIIDICKRLDQLQEFSKSLALKIKEWTPWGDFDPAEIHRLENKGIFVRLYHVPLKEIKNFPQGLVVKNIFTKEKLAYCAVFSQQKLESPFKEAELPKMSIAQMQARLNEDKRIIEAISEDLKGFFCHSNELIKVKNSLEKELEFRQALNTAAHFGSLSCLAGYIPFDSEPALMNLAQKGKWAISIKEPPEEDAPPTLIRNAKWISIISPIFKFLEILPGYHELDISLPFLVFFSLFFGILIGDAGYGLVYFLITFFLHRNALKKHKATSVFFLFYALSSCAIIWGILTGTFFGQEWFLKAGYKPLVPFLVDEKNIQRFCFFVGALHLSLAHSWRALIKLPSIAALSDLGWVSLLWAAFFIAKALILGDVFPLFAKWLIILGITAVVVFTNPQKNILKAIGSGLATLALSLMNSFTDVVSYVRLFAVGLAGVAISDAFNAVAKMLSAGNILALLAGGLVLMVGHSLALVLGPVSVLVHGVRLNVLEFSGHANVSWSGAVYKPLKD